MHIYADHAATSPLRAEALDAMMPWLTGEGYGNASSIYATARNAKKGLEEARRDIAEVLGFHPEEVYFTGGGTESDNWALKAAMELGARKKRRHLITTAIEHPAILKTAEWLTRQGFEVTILPVDALGRVTPQQVTAALRPDTQLVSVMYANNEIGTIEPIDDIFAAVKAADPAVLCHTDAVQAAGHIPLTLERADLVSLSGHKLGGPKGVGVLLIRRGVTLPPLMHGGGHERGRRSGTENVAGAAGMAAALRACRYVHVSGRLLSLRDRLIAGLSGIPYAKLTGDPVHRLPSHVSFTFQAVEGESLVLALDSAGVSVSSGSACSSGSLDPSHVLLAIGLPHAIAHGSLRFTLAEDVTEAEVDYLIGITRSTVADRRAMSPVWDAAAQRPIDFEI